MPTLKLPILSILEILSTSWQEKEKKRHPNYKHWNHIIFFKETWSYVLKLYQITIRSIKNIPQESLELKQQHEGCCHSGNRETNYQSCPVTSTYTLWHVYAHTHV